MNPDSLIKKHEADRPNAIELWCGKCENRLGHEFLGEGPDKISSRFWIYSHSLKFAHLLRYTNDSILVGKNTFLKDFPKLNCRLPGLFQFTPKIFIINGNLTIKPKHLRLYTKKTTIFHSCDDTKKISKYKKFFHLEKIKTTSGIISPNEILSRIYSLGSRRLLVEGGLKTLKLFEKSNLVNKYLLIRSNLNAPKVLSSAKSLIWSLCANNLSRSKVDINLSNDELFSIWKCLQEL